VLTGPIETPGCPPRSLLVALGEGGSITVEGRGSRFGLPLGAITRE